MWEYTDRRVAQEVLPGLWLGPYTAAKDAAFMAGITHVLIVAGEVETKFLRPQFPDRVVYKGVVLEESPFVQIFPLLVDNVQWIHQTLLQGGRVLVHGNSGMSRSAAVLVGYLIAVQSLSFDQALRAVQTARQCVSLSDPLKFQLKAFEPYVRALASSGATAAPPQANAPSRRKRGRDSMAQDEPAVDELFFEDK